MSNPPDKEIETYKKAGWLIKKGGTRGEKHGTKRWFVLKAQNLFYYGKEKDYPHQPKGGVDLHEAILIEQSFTKCEHGFQIVEVSGDEGRTYYLEPANQKDKEDWCEVIRQELPQTKKKKKAGGGEEGASTYRYRNIHCGYLTKRPSKDKAGKSAWQRRFFVLQPEALFYYQQPSDHLPPEKPKGSISLKDVTITMDSAEKHPYAFQINCKDDGKGEGKRKYFLEPDPASQAFRDEWLAAITIVLTNPEEAKLLAVTPSRQSRMSMGLSRPNSPTTPISPKGFKLTTSAGTSPVTSAPSSPRDYKKSEPGFSPRSDSKDGDTPKSSTPIFVPPFLRTGPSASNLLNNTPPSQSREVSPSSDTSSGPPSVTRALSSPGPSPPPTTRTIATGTTPSSSSMIALSTTDQNSPLGVQSLFRPSSAKGTGGGIGGRPAPITTTPIGGGESPGPASPTTEEPLSPSTPSSRFGSSGQQTPSSSRPSSAQHSRTSSVNRSRPPSFSSSNIPVIQEEGSEGRGNSASTFQVGENLSSSFTVRKTGGDLPIVPESSSIVVEVLPNRTSPESSTSTTGQRPRGSSMDPSGGPSTPSKLNISSEPPSPGGSNDSSHTRNQSTSLAAKMAAMGAVSLSGPLTPTKLPPPSPARKIVFPPIPVANPRKTVGQGVSPYGAPPPPPPLSHDAIASLAFLPPRTPSSGENNIPRSSSNQDLSQYLPPRSSSPQPPRPSTPQSISSSASMIQESPSKKTTNPSLTLLMPQNTLQIVPPGPPPTPDSRLESPFSVHSTSTIVPPGPPPTPPSQIGPSRDPFPPTGSEILPPSGPPPTSTSHRVIQMAPSDVLPPSGTPPESKKGSISGGPPPPDAYSTPVKKNDSKTTTTPASNVYFIAYSEESQMLGGSGSGGGQAPVTPRQNRLQQQQLIIQQQLQQEG